MSIAFDIGGTFTDVVCLERGSGRLRTTKILTTAGDPAISGLEGIRQLLDGTSGDEVEQVIHATTLVTNAVIERQGSRVGLITTVGFRDTLEIRHEQRYDVYDLSITLPDPLVPRHMRVGVLERIAADGSEISPLDELGLRRALDKLVNQEHVDAVAIAFLHSYKNPIHERKALDIARSEFPSIDFCTSSDVAPEIGEFERTSTVVVNSYVRRLARRYLLNLSHGLAGLGYQRPFQVMLSAGGITSDRIAAEFPVRMMESGPAAGVLAAVFYAEEVELRNVLSFDMGGTTAKFAVIRDRRPAIVGELETARVHRFKPGSGIPVRVPVIDMMEIGAGGGSIARVDQMGLLKVGPESAGSEPGPACYARGGTEPTVTDADVALGYVDPDYFLGGRSHLEHSLADGALMERVGNRLGLDVAHAAFGIYQVVTENMAAAARVHLAERGCNPLHYSMVAFGGAGPVHACSLAEALHVAQVVCPQDSGVASAVGLLVAPTAVDLSHSDVVELQNVRWPAVENLYADMKLQALAMLDYDAGRADIEPAFEASVDVRHAGQFFEFNLAVPWSVLPKADVSLVRELFFHRYAELFGRTNPDVPIECVNWRLRASIPGRVLARPAERQGKHPSLEQEAPHTRRLAWFTAEQGFVPVSVYKWEDLGPQMRISGPAIVEQDGSTVVVRPHWSAVRHSNGPLILDREDSSAAISSV